MQQLVGLKCARCQRTIPSIIDGEFCTACGNPVHKTCKSPDHDHPENCPSCGSLRASTAAAEVRAERKQEEQRPLQGNYPVSRACPTCRGTQFTTRRPERWISFVADRVCQGCGTIYTPPTPLWAAILFIVAGGLLAAFGTFALLVARSPTPLFCEGPLGVVGYLALIHGIRALVLSGKI